MPVALLAAILASAIVEQATEPFLILDAWTRDGNSVVFRARSETEAGAPVRMLFVADPAAGTFPSAFRMSPATLAQDAPVGDVWRSAPPPPAGQQWLEAHPLGPAARSVELRPGEPRTVAPPWDLLSRLDGCDLVLLAVSGGVRIPLLQDRCEPGDEVRTLVISRASLASTVDGRRIAVYWSVSRTAPGSDSDRSARGHAAYAPAAVLAPVDLLDAGAGEVDRIAQVLDGAGYPIGHKGKAKGAREVTAIYYADGFASQAKALAEVLGADPGAVQPQSWKSPFAITVAAGKRPR